MYACIYKSTNWRGKFECTKSRYTDSLLPTVHTTLLPNWSGMTSLSNCTHLHRPHADQLCSPTAHIHQGKLRPDIVENVPSNTPTKLHPFPLHWGNTVSLLTMSVFLDNKNSVYTYTYIRTSFPYFRCGKHAHVHNNTMMPRKVVGLTLSVTVTAPTSTGETRLRLLRCFWEKSTQQTVTTPWYPSWLTTLAQEWTSLKEYLHRHFTTANTNSNWPPHALCHSPIHTATWLQHTHRHSHTHVCICTYVHKDMCYLCHSDVWWLFV